MAARQDGGLGAVNVTASCELSASITRGQSPFGLFRPSRRLANGPSVTHSPSEHSSRYAIRLCDYVGWPSIQHVNIRSVVGLRFAGRPCAVRRHVPKITIQPLNRERGVIAAPLRPISEHSKVQPILADGNALSPIDWIRLVSAPSLHQFPYVVKSGARAGVSPDAVAKPIFRHAATARRFTFPEVCPDYAPFKTAMAPAQPYRRSLPVVACLLDYFPRTVFLSGEIDQARIFHV
jgi:hypothetical protein